MINGKFKLYLASVSSIELWCKGQGVQYHLTQKSSEMDEKTKAQWEKVGAQLCSLLWQSVDSKVMPLFLPFHTRYKVWEKAHTLYTDDISRFL